MNTSLSKTGYKIKKSDLLPQQIKEIKDELYVKPFTFTKNNQTDSGFQVYMESPKKLYLPRFYGLTKFNEPKENKMEEGDNITIEFNGGLRDEQKPIEEIYLKNVPINSSSI